MYYKGYFIVRQGGYVLVKDGDEVYRFTTFEGAVDYINSKVVEVYE